MVICGAHKDVCYSSDERVLDQEFFTFTTEKNKSKFDRFLFQYQRVRKRTRLMQYIVHLWLVVIVTAS